MIKGLDHVAVAVRDFDAGVDGYRRLLGREPELDLRGDGAKRAWFHLANMALEVVAPDGHGAGGERVRAHLETAGEGVYIFAFRIDDLAAATRLAERRGLEIEPVERVTRVHAAGLNLVLTPGRIGAQPSAATGPDEAVTPALDHLVIYTPNIDRALGIYGAKLGLDLRLDRVNERFGARQLFFRCGDAMVEIAASLKAPASDGPDRSGGLAWQVVDPEATHARLAAAGFDLSELRPGRKPGTRVFTVRDAPGGVPTLMIQPSPALESA